MANLLLIESPGKIRKLSQILGPGWIVKASVGHVRELANDGEDSLGFDLGERTVDCRYVPRSPKAKQILTELRQAVKQADAVYIATDPDREGETIGWHLQQALRLKQPQRVVYREITPAAVRAAIANPRQLDQSLIAAGRARDCLDKLVGYKGSRHVVWPLQNGAKSMGRVQSATLHLLCLREREILAFIPEDYWSVWVHYSEGLKAFYRRRPQASQVAARKFDGKSNGKADSKSSGKADSKSNGKPDGKADGKPESKAPESDRINSQAEADRLVELARTSAHQVLSIEGQIKHQSPPPPLITSTLQQAAGSKLHLSPERSMQVAQSLYEAGHITYMRTDSIELAAPFQAAVKQYLQQHDPENVPQRTASQRAAKGAQAAHEAIRPTHVERTPEILSQQLSSDEAKLYALIWNRAIASQCCPVRLRKTRIVTHCQNRSQNPSQNPSQNLSQDLPGEAFWEARGQVVEFEGYTRYWNNLSADSQLPALVEGQTLSLTTAQADPKQTQPPPRYTEPKLIQLMERKGIGRPSTYAPTLKTLRDRTYAELQAGKLVPTALGLNLDYALEQLLPDLIQPEFTAQMEAQLDAIATPSSGTSGDQDWERYLTGWYRDYFGPAIAQAQRKMGEVMSQPSRLVQASPESKAIPASKAPPGSKVISASKATKATKATKNPCPKCGQPLQKIPSKSKKMKANHFLKCGEPGCGTVMFLNPGTKQYELPGNQRSPGAGQGRSPDPSSFTDHPCPVCGALLEQYHYTKDGQAKAMLRCSVPERRQEKCKDVAYFQTNYSGPNGFWSPKFGNLTVPASTHGPTKS